jgi:hypothetical protein
VVEETMKKIEHLDSQELEVVVEADLKARRFAEELVAGRS